MVIAGTDAWPAVTGWKPDAMPPAILVQGAANVDCVTVWFFGLKTNVTVSPAAAVTDGGVNVRPDWPTMT
jgi:hypothetical protein